MNLRNEFAEKLRLLKCKSLSIDEFEEYYFAQVKLMKKNEDTDLLLIEEIFGQVWQMYDDFNDEYLIVNDINITEIDRYICFLESGLKYEWPKLGGNSILRFFSFGFYNNFRRKQLEKIGELNVWPFISLKNYQENC